MSHQREILTLKFQFQNIQSPKYSNTSLANSLIKFLYKQEIQVPPESLESHDTDEMDMSDDDETAAHLRYGKRSRIDIKVNVLNTSQDLSNLKSKTKEKIKKM